MSEPMNRRSFVAGWLGIGATTGFRLPLADAANYHGKLFVFVQADGGWDPTSFCDPKTNLAGEPLINHWAQAGEVRQAGAIRYAPFANNQAFFDKYHQRMLVINGVDAQTNSHSTGIVHNWSGRISEGYPTTTALLAAHNGQGLSMPYLSFGGFSNTAGITSFTAARQPESGPRHRGAGSQYLGCRSAVPQARRLGVAAGVPRQNRKQGRRGSQSHAEGRPEPGDVRSGAAAGCDRGFAGLRGYDSAGGRVGGRGVLYLLSEFAAASGAARSAGVQGERGS